MKIACTLVNSQSIANSVAKLHLTFDINDK